MANVQDHKTVGAPASNEERIVRVTYDFAEDGGAIGDLGLITANGELMITKFAMFVETAVTSAGAATMDAGVTGATDQFLNGVAKATLVADYAAREDAIGDLPAVLANGEQVTMSLADAAWTAGKVHFVIGTMKAAQ